MHATSLAVLLTAALAAPLLAQHDDATTTPPQPLALHAHAADPLGGDYGLWTAGADFKARFHGDGFEFFPFVPDAERTEGLRWRTTSVRLGRNELAGDPAALQHSDSFVELRRGEVVERYDVTTRGVEQSFRIDRCQSRSTRSA